MKSHSVILSFVLLAACALVSVYTLVPSEWQPLPDAAFPKQAERSEDAPRVTLHFYLRQNNLEALTDKFWEVSNPSHPSYGKYLTVEQLRDIVSPSADDLKTISNWLESSGFKNIEFARTQDAVKAEIDQQIAEKVFDVKLRYFVHNSRSKIILRSSEKEKLPKHIAPLVHLIRGVSDFPMLKRKTTTATTATTNIENPMASSKLTAGYPVVIEPRGGDSSISVVFAPVCTNGQTTTSTVPCQDYPPILTSVGLSAVSALDTSSIKKATTATPSCFQVTDANNNKSVNCRVTLEGVTNYQPMKLTVTANFGADAYSVNVPYYVVASPMVTPRTLASLYSIPKGARVTNPNATQSVVEFEEQYYSDNDLQMFFNGTGVIPSKVTVVGPNDQSNPGGEATLDIQYIMGVAPGAPTYFWSMKDNGGGSDDILQWAIDTVNTENPPLVNSISYGMPESYVDMYSGEGYLARSDIEFQKLALRGITVLIASGDTGAGDLDTVDGISCQSHLNGDWPSQSPYILSVGSTYITPFAEPICYMGQNIGGISCSSQPLGEVSVSVDAGMRWTTGGGFSNITSTPSYQQDFVDTYLATASGLPPSTAFNRRGRAYPDLAVVGHNLMVALNGQFTPIDGTSASSPIFAGIITLLNDARLNVGKPPLGFINPLLYKIARETPAAFTDIVVGRNACGAVSPYPKCCPFGFNASPGFDAVSGLGTPNYPVLREAILKA